MNIPSTSSSVTRREALKTGLIFSSAFLTAGWQNRLSAGAPQTDFGKKGIHFLAVGHYASERLGIRALGEHLAARFGLAHEFIDVPNPV